jgi:hypothetical protein
MVKLKGKKLALERHTLRSLNADGLGRANGGGAVLALSRIVCVQNEVSIPDLGRPSMPAGGCGGNPFADILTQIDPPLLDKVLNEKISG